MPTKTDKRDAAPARKARPARPTAPPPRQAAFLALIRTADRVMAEHAALFRRYDITEPQYNALRILRGAGPSGLACQEIGQRMMTRVPDITRLLDRLERTGLASRERDENDRRVVTTRLSRKGRALLQKLDQPVLEMHELQFGRLSDSDARQLTTILGRLEAGIEDRRIANEGSST